MVQRVLILEDIAADAAVQIVSIFTALQDKAPEVFHLEKNKETSKGDIIRYVKKWNRFKELVGKFEKLLSEFPYRCARSLLNHLSNLSICIIKSNQYGSSTGSSIILINFFPQLQLF